MNSMGCFADNINKFLHTCAACSEVVFKFELMKEQPILVH